ncbi:MAG TPA: hypothetical protein VGM51_02735 [Armatimonadota bacterium]|jgi:hypothetical protein
MITAKRETRILTFVALALVVGVIVAMYFIARGARGLSEGLRVDFAAPGPPVTRANLKTVMGDVPVAPFFMLDENATNDRALRLQMSMILGRGRGEWILVFRSTEPYSTAASWYQRHLEGWAVDRPDDTTDQRERQRNGIQQLGWTRNGDRLTLVHLPDRPGEVLVFVSSTPPRKRKR